MKVYKSFRSRLIVVHPLLKKVLGPQTVARLNIVIPGKYAFVSDYYILSQVVRVLLVFAQSQRDRHLVHKILLLLGAIRGV